MANGFPPASTSVPISSTAAPTNSPAIESPSVSGSMKRKPKMLVGHTLGSSWIAPNTSAKAPRTHQRDDQRERWNASAAARARGATPARRTASCRRSSTAHRQWSGYWGLNKYPTAAAMPTNPSIRCKRRGPVRPRGSGPHRRAPTAPTRPARTPCRARAGSTSPMRTVEEELRHRRGRERVGGLGRFNGPKPKPGSGLPTAARFRAYQNPPAKTTTKTHTPAGADDHPAGPSRSRPH